MTEEERKVRRRKQCREASARYAAKHPEKVKAMQAKSRLSRTEAQVQKEKEMQKKRSARWYEDNRELQRARGKQYSIDNKERRSEVARQYRETSKEKLREYRSRNSEKRNKNAKVWRANNKTAIKKYTQQYYLEKGKSHIESLSDGYIKHLLVVGTSLNHKDVPLSLVEAKREHVKLTRLLRERKQNGKHS